MGGLFRTLLKLTTEIKVLCKEGVYAENACYSFKQAECLLKDILNFTNIFTTTANLEKHVADKIAGFNETMYKQISAELESVNKRLNKSIQEKFEVITSDFKKAECDIKKLDDHLDKLTISTGHVNQEISEISSSIRGDIEKSISVLRSKLEDQRRGMSSELEQRDVETKEYLDHNSETLKSDLKEINLTFVETTSSLSKRIADMNGELWINETDEGGETQRISVKEEMVIIQKQFEANNTRLQHNIDYLQMKCQSQFKTLNDQVKIVNDSYTQLVSDTTNQIKSLQEKTKSIENNLATFRKENKDDILLVQAEIEKEKGNVLEMKERLENNIKATEVSLKNAVETTQTSLQNEFDKALNEFKANISEELHSVRVEIEKIKIKLEDQLGNVTRNVSCHKAIIDVKLPNTFNKDFFMLDFMLLCLMVILNFVVLLFCVTKSRSTSAMIGQWATGTGKMTGKHRASRSPLQVSQKL